MCQADNDGVQIWSTDRRVSPALKRDIQGKVSCPIHDNFIAQLEACFLQVAGMKARVFCDGAGGCVRRNGSRKWWSWGCEVHFPIRQLLLEEGVLVSLTEGYVLC